MSSSPLVRIINSILPKQRNIGFVSTFFYKVQTPIFVRMGETPVGEGGRLMTALAEGELAKAAPPRFAESILTKIAFPFNKSARA